VLQNSVPACNFAVSLCFLLLHAFAPVTWNLHSVELCIFSIDSWLKW
jgi:hypothetical protein